MLRQGARPAKSTRTLEASLGNGPTSSLGNDLLLQERQLHYNLRLLDGRQFRLVLSLRIRDLQPRKQNVATFLEYVQQLVPCRCPVGQPLARGPEFGTFSEGCANLNEVSDDLEAVRAARECVAQGYYRTAIYKDTATKHPVEITAETVAGVYTEVFVPKRGIAEGNKNRLLISIHGGGFAVGARYFSHT